MKVFLLFWSITWGSLYAGSHFIEPPEKPLAVVFTEASLTEEQVAAKSAYERQRAQYDEYGFARMMLIFTGIAVACSIFAYSSGNESIELVLSAIFAGFTVGMNDTLAAVAAYTGMIPVWIVLSVILGTFYHFHERREYRRNHLVTDSDSQEIDFGNLPPSEQLTDAQMAHYLRQYLRQNENAAETANAESGGSQRKVQLD